MQSDIEIARSISLRPIVEIAERLGLDRGELQLYGDDVAKVALSVLDRLPEKPRGRLVLISAITPTPAGEGKTTTAIGLADGLTRIGESACLALREPSLGPALGMKGGATGGGRAQVAPKDRIDLHFTGDFHAITTANNLLAAQIDNSLHQGNPLGIDPRRVLWRRAMDMNDRALREIVVGLGGASNGVPREAGFDITAASEVMAMFCLASGVEDLRARLDRTLVAFDGAGAPVFASALGVTGAMLALLLEALRPNLVQTLEGTPAFVHGGPFANIAHGCNSVLATRMASGLADWAVTEAGFGFDLGAEKFFDIKCVEAGLEPSAVVLVATIRALKMHGGVDLEALERPDAEAVGRGLENLERHVESARTFGFTPIVALNHFAADTPEEVARVESRCRELGLPFALADHFVHGGAGGEALARVLVEHAAREPGRLQPIYPRAAPIAAKIEAVATRVYGARSVAFTGRARHDLARIDRLRLGGLPVCIAKVPGSLSDDPKRRGRPRDFEITVRELRIAAGAGFVVALTGEILRMPGLPRAPRAASIDVRDGRIEGLG
ncbi:MAG: formate--tetrahydrofolate ligase [Spirochaetaceae bacterium]|nr:formate--tetrahydrofolate ligase [Myxococcales bacterium]MCB9726060.1 formate--tetrahydrofolate ligase [Spirochaetaceae bacterium]